MRQNAREARWYEKSTMFLGLVVFLLIIVSLVRNLYGLAGLDRRLVEARQELDKLRARNQELQFLADRVSSGELDEEYIRNTLELSRPGETVVIIPDDLLDKPLYEAGVDGHMREDLSPAMKWKRLLL